MNINELERLTGITKQNIRFYEKKGLLHPARNSENNYREYTKEDLICLKAVKLLRKLDLPLEDIRKILQDEEPLSEALSQHLKTLQEKQQELSACIDVCNNLLQKAKSQAAQTTLRHSKVKAGTLSDMGPDSMQSNTAQTAQTAAQDAAAQTAQQPHTVLSPQLALLDIDETLRKMDEIEKNGGKFMSIIKDYQKFSAAERLKGFSFKPDTMVMNAEEFKEALLQYAEENQLNLTIIKEGMYPLFRIDNLEYKAERIFDRFGATIHCSLTNPEELETGLEHIPPARKRLYSFFHGPWFFLLVLFIVMAISRQSFFWAFFVLAMVGPYLFWLFIRYFR